MNTVHSFSQLETPTLSINHCSDVSCSHPSCWASRKLYRRNAYLLMLKGELPTDVSDKERPLERSPATHREIPTQKVHNIVDELFRSASDSDDWQSVARGISAGQLSMKHMPTPMSSLSRNASKLRYLEGFDTEADETGEAVDKTGKHLSQIHMQEMFQPSGPHSVYHSREYVWVPNQNRKPKEILRHSEPDSIGRVNINEELGYFLHEDTYNQRQAALQERAVERSHLSTARVQRFFKSCPQASSTKHVDLFKLPSNLLTEVLRNVDEGEPMTDESLAKMVEQAETPTGGGDGGAKDDRLRQQQQQRRDFQQHVLRQRRAQLHQSEAGRNLREPQKHTAKPPIFLMDESPSSGGGAEAASTKRRQQQATPAAGRQRLPPIGGGGTRGAAATVTGQFAKRPAASSRCQLMLGPVTAAADGGGGGSVGSTGRRTRSGADDGVNDNDDDAGSLNVECRSDRSTLLDEVLPSRKPGTVDTGLAALLAMNRPSYDLDDPWADAAGGPHPTTRNQSMLTASGSAASMFEELQPAGPPASVAAATTTAAAAAAEGGASGVHLSLITPVPGEAADEDAAGVDDQQEPADEEDRASSLLLAPNTGRTMSPGPPPPSPDVDAAVVAAPTPRPLEETEAAVPAGRGGAVNRPSSPPPPPASSVARREGAAAPLLSKAKSAASSGQMMPTLNEDEEDEEQAD